MSETAETTDNGVSAGAKRKAEDNDHAGEGAGNGFAKNGGEGVAEVEAKGGGGGGRDGDGDGDGDVNGQPQAKKAKEGDDGLSHPKPSEKLPEIVRDGKKYWKFDDGTEELIVDILEEPRHHLDFSNPYGRSFTIKFPPKDVTLAHGHEYDTIVVLLMKGGIKFINHVMGCCPQEGCLSFKDVRFAPYTSQPCVHKITNLADEEMFCINIEIVKKPPLVQPQKLEAKHHKVVMEREGACRVYKLSLGKGESADVSYNFFYTHVVVSDKGKVEVTKRGKAEGTEVTWVEESVMGLIQWKEPCPDMTIRNVGDDVYEAYVCEWC